MLIVLNTGIVKAQGNSIKSDTIKTILQLFIPGDFIRAEGDNQNNIIVVHKNGRLTKYNEKGDSLACFNDVLRMGRPSTIDVSNPMKIIVWSQRLSILTILDRWLTQRNQIKIKEAGGNAIQAIGCSYDNNIWYFNNIDQQLKKIDEQNHLLIESNDMRSVVGETINPITIQDHNGWVVLNDTSKGIFLFDQLGVFKTKLAFKWQDAFLQGNVIYGYKDNRLHEYDIKSLEKKSHWLDFISADSRRMKTNGFSILQLKKEGLYLYKIIN
jgi:hypothetical protein